MSFLINFVFWGMVAACVIYLGALVYVGVQLAMGWGESETSLWDDEGDL